MHVPLEASLCWIKFLIILLRILTLVFRDAIAICKSGLAWLNTNSDLTTICRKSFLSSMLNLFELISSTTYRWYAADLWATPVMSLGVEETNALIYFSITNLTAPCCKWAITIPRWSCFLPLFLVSSTSLQYHFKGQYHTLGFLAIHMGYSEKVDVPSDGALWAKDVILHQLYEWIVNPNPMSVSDNFFKKRCLV